MPAGQTHSPWPFRITICGQQELGDHCALGVSHVVSIMDPEKPAPEALGSYGEHARLDLRFHDVIEDGATAEIAPQDHHIADILAFGRDLASPGGAHLLVHCQAGISRSTAALTLIMAQAMPDWSGERLLAEVLRLRDKAWPNMRMLELGEAQLGRKGELVPAASAIYRFQLERRPHLADFMRNSGRHREVAAAGW